MYNKIMNLKIKILKDKSGNRWRRWNFILKIILPLHLTQYKSSQ